MTHFKVSDGHANAQSEHDWPQLSIVVPIHNGGDYFSRCVAALATSTFTAYELIIVDDASDERLPETAIPTGAHLLRLPNRSGPAVARNRGTGIARSPLVLFLDVDVMVTEHTLQTIVDGFARDADLDALFGSYDSSPSAENFVSQYRNLLHHFVHQSSRSKASTFWAGCGAIRREAFQAVGGFSSRFRRPSIEDIELGNRLVASGHQIKLDSSIQVKHLKRWTLWKMLKCDIFDRGVPWTRLILASGHMPDDLNLRLSQRISCILTLGLVIVMLLSIWAWSGAMLIACGGVLAIFAIDFWTETRRIPDCLRFAGMGVFLTCALLSGSELPVLFTAAAVLVFAVAVINRDFFVFLCRNKYPLFAIVAFPLHILFFTYCGVALGIGVVSHFWDLKTSSRAGSFVKSAVRWSKTESAS